MSFIDIDNSFDQLTVKVLGHQLSQHPLMSTDSLAALALRMDPEYVRFHDGDRELGTNMNTMLKTDDTRASLRHAIGNLHKVKTFVQMINVRSDPAYRALLDEVFAELLPFFPARDRELLNRDAAA